MKIKDNKISKGEKQGFNIDQDQELWDGPWFQFQIAVANCGCWMTFFLLFPSLFSLLFNIYIFISFLYFICLIGYAEKKLIPTNYSSFSLCYVNWKIRKNKHIGKGKMEIASKTFGQIAIWRFDSKNFSLHINSSLQ